MAVSIFAGSMTLRPGHHPPSRSSSPPHAERADNRERGGVLFSEVLNLMDLGGVDSNAMDYALSVVVMESVS